MKFNIPKDVKNELQTYLCSDCIVAKCNKCFFNLESYRKKKEKV